MNSVLLGLVMAGTACFVGCMSDVPKDTFTPIGDLNRAVITFQIAEKRWPRDYEELSDFLKHSDDPAYTRLEAVKFHRLDFINQLDGGLKVDVNYTTASGDATVSDSQVLSVPKVVHGEQDNGR